MRRDPQTLRGALKILDWPTPDNLDGALDRLPDLLKAATPFERAELVAAAHTVIVVSSYLEAMSTMPLTPPGPKLLSLSVPVPSAAIGFDEHSLWFTAWCFRAAGTEGMNGPLVSRDSVAQTHSLYVARYLELAASVPEFRLWARTEEGPATTQGMARLEILLRRVLARTGKPRDLRHVLSRRNQAELDRPIMLARTESGPADLCFPRLDDIHLNPRYRICLTSPGNLDRPGDERWWDGQPVRHDLDVCLAVHLLTAEAAERPLLLLGHPGAGKSLLTKVLAARLPPEAYTVVRVPLRAVPANGRILQQIQSALDIATNDAVQWRPLVEQSLDTTRIVLLDGLDELLRATPDDRTGYLHEVSEFQANELAQDRPAIVVVTSRTVVADRIDIPHGTTVIKLEAFDDAQVEAWLAEWNRANTAAIVAGTVRALSPAAALRRPELSRQPLLLLMLALYAADPSVPELEHDVSITELYRRLFDVFAAREVDNRADPPHPYARTEAVRQLLDRLSTAALAMFNRGRQDITGAELAADLVNLGMARVDVLGDSAPGRRLLGEFFFVHVAEATNRDATHRAYEFLHATFGEYLVARRVLDVLVETAERAFGGRYGPYEPDDDLLFALLSHQSLATSPPTLEFIRDQYFGLPERDRRDIPRLLSVLMSGYRSRRPSARHAGYRPLPIDHARAMAAYSANLVLLSTAFATSVPLAQLLPEAEDLNASWSSTVNLWRAALDPAGWQATIRMVMRTGDALARAPWPEDFPNDVLHADLTADLALLRTLNYGHAATGSLVSPPGSSWSDAIIIALLPVLLSPVPAGAVIRLIESTAGVDPEEVRKGVSFVWRVLRTRTVRLEFDDWCEVIDWTLRVASSDELDLDVVASLVAGEPRFLHEMRRLCDPSLYHGSLAARLRLRAAAAAADPDPKVVELAGALTFDDLPEGWDALDPAELGRLLRILRPPRDPIPVAVVRHPWQPTETDYLA
ncbi:hypothetical protein [Dactylosporangium salmoneum]|uniref:AAA+ ATPase domain-containing protein n=1 Tax=Dactylosporangium salmoneum TaxID=53361 RepID=A0ABP5UUZ2_9ACTN